MLNKNLDNMYDKFTELSKTTEYKTDIDLDKLNMKHKKHIQSLNNIFESITHKTVFLTITIILIVAFLSTRYLQVIFPEYKIFSVINYDSKIAITYFATAVLSSFITKHLS